VGSGKMFPVKKNAKCVWQIMNGKYPRLLTIRGYSGGVEKK
jgi:hypothetical protein